MSYTKNTWQCGDVVTADKLNNIEDGVEQALECCGGGSEPLVVTIEMGSVPCPTNPTVETDQYTYSHSWQEIYDALASKRPVYVAEQDEDEDDGLRFASVLPILAAEYSADEYVVYRFDERRYRFADATSKVYVVDCGK